MDEELKANEDEMKKDWVYKDCSERSECTSSNFFKKQSLFPMKVNE